MLLIGGLPVVLQTVELYSLSLTVTLSHCLSYLLVFFFSLV